jgi:hypothetical protein
VGEIARHYQAIGTDEGAACCADAALAIGGERDVGDTCVTAVERPFGLAVTDDEDSGSRHGGRIRREEWGVRGAESEAEERQVYPRRGMLICKVKMIVEAGVEGPGSGRTG